MTFWTLRRIARLKALLGDDATYSEIAYELDCTRGAVAGKVKRLGAAATEKPPRRYVGRLPHRWTEEVLTERWADRNRHHGH